MSNNFSSTNNSAPAAPAPSAGQLNFDPAGTAAPRSKNRWVTPVLGIAAALVVGLFGGIGIGQSIASTSASGAGAGGLGAGGSTTGRPADGMGGPTGAGGGTSGTITSIDGSTIKLKLADGSTVSVTTKAATTVTKSTKSTVAALAAGETISVRGTADSSGTVAATRITEGQTPFGATPPTASTK